MKWVYCSDVFDVASVAVIPGLAAFVSLDLRLPYVLSVLCFYGTPAVLIAIRHLPWTAIWKAALFSLIVPLPFGLVVDYVGTLSGLWYVPHTVFPFRLFGLIPFEDLVWLVAAVFLILIVFLMLERPVESPVLDKRLANYSVPAFCVTTAFIATASSHQAIAQWNTPYAYILLGSAFFAIPSILLLAFSDVKALRLVPMVVYFAYSTLVFEFTATVMRQWIFLGQYSVPPLNVYGISGIPIEELIFVGIFGPLTTIALYDRIARIHY